MPRSEAVSGRGKNSLANVGKHFVAVARICAAPIRLERCKINFKSFLCTVVEGRSSPVDREDGQGKKSLSNNVSLQGLGVILDRFVWL